ncbi:hypothetical protein M1247_24970 [Mycobacterium sp. 21AC1]|uniref:hypothetical protein n=1 Tax=[Mycobacterium] appelbergii TaxID=2939269 RepID=UPI002938D60C|nr:hypothetical protein [Mycobacterium sp. 21AC1]MDV3128190.1 hypothetical protein [Mycobacterium sp. 21AC1]
MSDPLGPTTGPPLPTYAARVRAIRTILGNHVPFGGLIQNNRAANPIPPYVCLSATWGVSVTATPTLSIAIHHVEDVAKEVDLLRYAADRDAYELRRDREDEFALVQPDLSSVWVVAGGCEVHLVHHGINPEKLVEPAIEIARTVGCTPYTDDYVPPPLPQDSA